MTTKITEKNISGIANSAVQWQSVITADGSTNTTGVAGQGYFIDTTSATHTIVLPSSPNVGDTIQIRDYAASFGTNNVTLDVGSLKLAGSASNGIISTNDAMVTLVYSGEDKGWLSVENEAKTNLIPPLFTSATGGTETTSGDYKIHSFTSSGCFAVSQLGNSPSVPAGGPTTVSYLVIAGGGGGGGNRGTGGGAGGGGGGAGGFREGKDTDDTYTASPLDAGSGITITASTYPITVGAGGLGGPTGPTPNTASLGGQGSNSVFSTITSAGGGGGFMINAGGTQPTANGGSGGGGGADGDHPTTGGTGNTPPVSPPQGNPAGNGIGSGPGYGGGGGGGAGAAGGNGTPTTGGNGGNGVASSITGSPVTRAGGGSSGTYQANTPGTAGTGGGGTGASNGGVATSGTANTGGGGGSVGTQGPGIPSGTTGAGGSGIVIIRYKYQ